MSETTSKERCPECAKNGGDTSGDNLVVYSNGTKHCFKCGYDQGKYSKGLDLIPGKVADLTKRGLTRATCEKYGVRQTEFSGYINKNYPQVTNEPIVIFPFTREGKTVYQKIRGLSIKDMMGVRGELKNKGLWGKDRFHPNKQWSLVITEGEMDCMSVFQMSGSPAVSLPDGAGSASKAILGDMEWLSQWKEVLLCFDNDEAGKEAIEKCIGLFEPGTVRNVTLPLKDANDMLVAGRADEFKRACWNAERIRPSTIVFPEDIREKVFTRPEYGSPWPWPSMTKATYGMRKGELYLLAAATSIGKTEFVREIVNQLLENGQKAGVFSLEQQPEQTMQRYIGAAMGQRLYLPGCEGWDEEVMQTHYERFKRSVALYQPSSGVMSLDALLTNIRWLNKAEGMEFFVIDNLKALATNPQIDGKRVSIHDYASYCMGAFFTICKQLNLTVFVLNHLAEDKISKQAYVSTSPKNADEYLDRSSEDMQKYINRPGMTWETGRVPAIENIFGGGNIKDLTDFIIVLFRNRMSEDYDEHRKLGAKILKSRLDSTYEGYRWSMHFDYASGRLLETNDDK